MIATVLVDLLGDLSAVTPFENGMLGVGLATSASYYASLLVLLISFKKSGGSLRFTFRNMDWGFAGELFTRGMPKAVRRFCNVIRPWLINRMILISRAAGVFCRENGIDARRSYYAALCIEELAINDVTHGFYKEGQSAAIYLSALNNGELTIRFRDNGRNFDLTKWCNLFKEEDKAVRIGIRMVVALAKDITYTNSFNTNNLKIDF